MSLKQVAIVVVLCLSPWPARSRAADATPVLKEVRVSEAMDGDTVRVWWSRDKEVQVRYQTASAAELKEVFGPDARRLNDQLTVGKTVWLELQPNADGYYSDRSKRLLAYVFLDKDAKNCVNVELVRQGAARLDVRDVHDETPDDDFAVKHLDRLLTAQIEACRARRGWWARGDPHADSDLVIVFIKFWGKNETLYLVNRGQQPVNLGDGYQLADKDGKNKFRLVSAFPTGECLLPPNGVCRIHTGRHAEKPPPVSGGKEMDIGWSKRTVWNNDGDEAALTDRNGKVISRYTYKGRGG